MKNDKEHKVLFQIKGLKKDMIHCATESISISILSLLLFIGAPSVFPKIIDPYKASSLKIMQAIIIVPTVYWLLTLICNLVRSVMIFKLRKQLSPKTVASKKK
jgi:hypothetical protein